MLYNADRCIFSDIKPGQDRLIFGSGQQSLATLPTLAEAMAADWNSIRQNYFFAKLLA